MAADKEKRIGLIVGREWSFPPAFIEEVNGRGEGVTAEFVQLGGTKMDDLADYAVLIDRISHEVPYYRVVSEERGAAGRGGHQQPVHVDGGRQVLRGASLATKLGVAHPKTVVLPNKDYVPGIVHTRRACATSSIRWTGREWSTTSACRAC